jgi:hypothetical protein
MIIAPAILGITTTQFHWLQLALLTGYLLGYMAGSALLQYLRHRSAPRPKRALVWAVVFGSLALACIIPPVLRHPGVCMILIGAGCALPIDLTFLRLQQERSLVSGIVSISALTTSSLATYTLGHGILDVGGWIVWALCLAFFVGSLLFVKSKLRRRGEIRFLLISAGYHLTLVAACVVACSPLVTTAFVVSAVRATALWPIKLKANVIGLIEMTNVIAFVVLVSLSGHVRCCPLGLLDHLRA